MKTLESEILIKTENNELRTATTDELFTELMKRVTEDKDYQMHFIDRTTVYPLWSVYKVTDSEPEILAKEIVK